MPDTELSATRPQSTPTTGDPLEHLSLPARGLLDLLTQLLSGDPMMPNRSLESIAARTRTGITGVRSALHELKTAGYVTVGQERQAGRFTAPRYTITRGQNLTKPDNG